MEMKNADAEEKLLNELNEIQEGLEKGQNDIFLNERFMSALQSYFTNLAGARFDKVTYDIFSRFSVVRTFLRKNIEGKRRSTFQRTMAIGQTIEILIHFGMPRIVAIEGLALSMESGISTVRIANEEYKKLYPAPLHLVGDAYLLSSYIFDMRKILEEIPYFKSGHLTAAEAFSRLTAVVNADPYQEILKNIK